MSGIAGVIQFDGRPVEPGRVEAMTAAMHYRGPDGIDHWRKGNVALGQCMLRTTPESLDENQPLANEDASLVLVMDGRVDNWEELRRELLGKGAVLRARADAELVLRAYEIWGRDCLEHIEGDFALVIWDARRQEAFCARDRLGIKPLHYHWENNVLSFASELQALLRLPWVAREFNIGMISEYLADSLMSRDETFFRDCFRLPAASAMRVGSSRKSIAGYWTPEGVSELHLGKEEDYVDCLADLLTRATSRRVRAVSKIGVLLSGGVDSAAVTCFARSVMPAQTAGHVDLEAFSLVFPGMPCDESQAIESFLSRTGLKGLQLAGNQPNIEGWRRNLEHFRDFPDSPVGAAYYPLLKMASEWGCRVMLGGWGSDDWIGGGLGVYADLVRRGGLGAIKQRFSQDIRQRGLGNAIRLMLGYGVRPVLRRGILAATGMRQLPFRGGKSSLPPWLGGAMAQAYQARRKLEAEKGEPKMASYQKAGQLRWLHSGMFALNSELQERSCAWNGVEGRYPFNDRTIVEFAFALPDRVKWQFARPKQLLIKAIRQRFPSLSKHHFLDHGGSPIYLNAVRSEQVAAMAISETMKPSGWIEPGAHTGLYRKIIDWYDQGDERYALHVRSLWQVVALDAWYQQQR